jgi:SAM-dependent methyltransferase/uncharacterized membrane protein YbhN (UPF0104 family)
MSKRSLRWAAAVLFIAGAAVVVAWVRLSGGPGVIAGILRISPAHGLTLLGITAVCVFLRFVRWQYLLRRVGIRVPARRSLTIYLSSLTGIATPAYLGETVRCGLLRREFGVPLRATLPIWLVERGLDFVVIGLLGLAAAAGYGFVAAVVLAAVVAAAVGETQRVKLGRLSVALVAFALSVASWLPAMLLLAIAARGLDVPLSAPDGMRIFATATLGGGVSLMPAGMGATGSLAILQLEKVGLSVVDAVQVVSIFRLATVGITLAIGSVFLLLEVRGLRRRPPADQIHFDQIASEYLNQFAPHIWDLLLERKTNLLCSAIPPAPAAGTGLDLGCGLGLQANALRNRGYRVIGLDAAHELVRRAADSGLHVVTGSAMALPFSSGSLDFVYTVGVLHHLPGREEQRAAVREVMRVLKPGGVFMVHETNPRNPLFRLYMGYVFPLLRSIDEGIEHWIDTDRWAEAEGLQVERVEYFTFLPDFLPRGLLPGILALERRLERSRFRPYSVHYMAVMRKRASDYSDTNRDVLKPGEASLRGRS